MVNGHGPQRSCVGQVLGGQARVTMLFELRAALASERNLMGAVARIFADSVMGWYRRRLAPGVPEARGGVVTVIQRSSSDMKLNDRARYLA